MHATHLNTVSITAAKRQIFAAALCGNKPLLVGSPGIGKTSICEPLALELGIAMGIPEGLHYQPLIGTTLDSTDVGGAIALIPDADGATRVHRCVLEALRLACERPTLLVIDELTCLPDDVKAALLDVIQSRKVGDGTPLHAQTVLVALTNPIEQAPNASEPAASLINRFCPIVRIQPTVEEVVAYFSGHLGADDSDDVAAPWFRDWAATAAHVTELLQFDPPDISINEGAPWASPRAWEFALRQAAALEVHGATLGLSADDIREDVFVGMAGAVGSQKAQNYLAVRDLRDRFDTPQVTAADPHKAKLPDAVSDQVGALGLLQEVARLDAYAAWVYAARLREEIGQAAARALTPRAVPRKSKWAKDGERARIKLMSRIGRRRRRRQAAA